MIVHVARKDGPGFVEIRFEPNDKITESKVLFSELQKAVTAWLKYTKCGQMLLKTMSKYGVYTFSLLDLAGNLDNVVLRRILCAHGIEGIEITVYDVEEDLVPEFWYAQDNLFQLIDNTRPVEALI